MVDINKLKNEQNKESLKQRADSYVKLARYKNPYPS